MALSSASDGGHTGKLSCMVRSSSPPDSKELALIPETAQNVLCGLSILSIGILGIIAGPIIFIKAMRMKEDSNHRRGPI
ncbi:HLA class II histocompatibility antigen, DR alpha chain-like [Rhineura floridana]|uniref:HLA class II histocompatibility antigen, DR alpha chain-like n=1 Tax=Rhineura floridana TaxID=261503 RepID=UPI002AC857C2|nr:HLA class II histocompatibility antigen, DR alpha chain-like [Rhineura floridana]XP_061477430.1 HLA class II histocompatibility antigen, DR alpha chain-like [Rhineura floridana]